VKRKPENMTQRVSAPRAPAKKGTNVALKRQKVQVAEAVPKFIQQDLGENINVDEDDSHSRNIVAAKSRSQKYLCSAIILDRIIPFLMDPDISGLCNASPVIAEAMDPLYSSTVFPHSEAIFNFMRSVQRRCTYPLRLPPPGLTPKKFYDIVSNPSKCCRCSQPLPTSILYSSSSTYFKFCYLCSSTERGVISSSEAFYPMELDQAKRLVKDLRVPEALCIRVNYKTLPERKTGGKRYSKGVTAYLKFGFDWILRDNPGLATNAAKELNDNLSCFPSSSVSKGELQAESSLKSVLCLTELPTWINDHFLMEQLRKKKLGVRKEADFIRDTFTASSNLYTWIQTIFTGLHKQTKEFVNVKTLMDASMSKNLQKLKDDFVTKAHHCSDMMYALETWGESPTREWFYALEDCHPRDIPDVIYKRLPNTDSRADWLREHAEDLGMPSGLLNYFSNKASPQDIRQDLCLSDAAWRWEGLSELLSDKEQEFAMKHYQTQRWVFGVNPTLLTRKQVARALNIAISLREEVAEFDELADIEFDSWESAQKALNNARKKRRINDKKAKMLEEMPPEVRSFMCAFYSEGFTRSTWYLRRLMEHYNKASSIATTKAVIKAASEGYEQLQSFMQSIPETHHSVVHHLVEHQLHKPCGMRKHKVDSFLDDLRQYLEEREDTETYPDMLKSLIQDIYPREHQRFRVHKVIRRVCHALQPHVAEIEVLLHNQSDPVKKRVRRAAYFLLCKNTFRSYVERTRNRNFFDDLQEVLKLATWEDQSAPLPVWVSPKLLAFFLQELSIDPYQVISTVANEKEAYMQLEGENKSISMIDARFNIFLPREAQKWFKTHEQVRKQFLSQLHLQERLWKSSSSSARKGLPEICIKRLQKIADTHWRGCFEAIDQLNLELTAVSVRDWAQLDSSEHKSELLTPDIKTLLLDGYFDLAARRLGFYFPRSELARRNKEWCNYTDLKIVNVL